VSSHGIDLIYIVLTNVMNSEQVYQKEAFPTMNDTLFPQPSVHLLTWPKYNDSMIRPELDKQFHVAQDVITAVLGIY
jgi:valyl-tRNA synthetase